MRWKRDYHEATERKSEKWNYAMWTRHSFEDSHARQSEKIKMRREREVFFFCWCEMMQLRNVERLCLVAPLAHTRLGLDIFIHNVKLLIAEVCLCPESEKHQQQRRCIQKIECLFMFCVEDLRLTAQPVFFFFYIQRITRTRHRLLLLLEMMNHTSYRINILSLFFTPILASMINWEIADCTHNSSAHVLSEWIWKIRIICTI